MKIKTDIDWSGLNKIQKQMERLEQREVKAGYGDEIHTESGLKMSQLASYMENGVRGDTGMKIPPRPFIAQALTIWQDSIEKESMLVVDNAIKGKDAVVNKHLQTIAAEGIASLQDSIEMQNFKELSPITVRIKEAKGSRFARDMLLDSGELFQSATSDIK